MKRITLVFLALITWARATVFNAATCSQADINTAYGLCNPSGDTIQLPAGSATWTAKLTLSGKSVTLAGAAGFTSHITINYAADTALSVDCSSNFNRVTGIDWLMPANIAVEGAIQFTGADTGTRSANFRFDNNNLTVGAVSAGVASRPVGIMFVWGVVDHNSFVQTTGTTCQFVQTYGSSDPAGDAGQTPWNFALSLGTVNAVYYENNTFDQRGCTQGDDCLDVYGGARIVIRYNIFLDCTHGAHGMDSGSRRSALSGEVYNNSYTNNTSFGPRHATVRGGCWVFFNNTYAGTATWNAVTLQYYRAYQGIPQGISFQQCDGTTYYFPTSGAAPLVTTGGRAFDNTNNRVLGTNTGTSTTPVDGLGTAGYPGRDQPGWAPGMILTPIYLWNNTGTKGNTAETFAGGSPPDEAKLTNLVAINREWFNATTMPGYTAYTYPYPGTSSTITPSTSMVGKSALIGKSKPL